jgi:hypothetical protein
VFILAFAMSMMGLLVGVILPYPSEGADFVVYSVFRGISLGTPGEEPSQKDFYVNMGSLQGVKIGSVLEVSRRVSSYDLINEQFYRDVVFPIARIKVIHVEPSAAIARLEKMLPAEKTPVISPKAVMVGDLVRVVQ